MSLVSILSSRLLMSVDSPCRLEIGAGGGLVGLAVAKGCLINQSQPLYITDQLEMFSLMEHNIVLNEVDGRVKALVLNWLVFVQCNRLPPPFSSRNCHACHALYAATRNLVYWGRRDPAISRSNVIGCPYRSPLPGCSHTACTISAKENTLLHIGQRNTKSFASNHALSTTCQGRAAPRRDHPAEAECHPGRRLRLLRTCLPASLADAGRTAGAQPLVRRLLLFQEETARRHAVPEERQEAVRRGRGC